MVERIFEKMIIVAVPYTSLENRTVLFISSIKHLIFTVARVSYSKTAFGEMIITKVK